jgi:hypothetical protein
MGRVNRLLERRALRRAADLALLTTLGNSTPSQAGGRPDQDFKYNRVEPADTPASYDHEPTTDPIPVVGLGTTHAEPAEAEAGEVAADDYGWSEELAAVFDGVDVAPAPADVYDLVPSQPADPERDDAREVAATEQAVPEPDDWWDAHEDVPLPAPAPARPPLRARPVADVGYVQPALDFAATGSAPWYRTKPAAAVLVAAIIAAVVCGGWLVLRSPSTTAEQPTEAAPTSAPPAPSTAAPTAMSAPAPPPAPPPPLPPPPPPPPAEPAYSAPQRQYSPRYSDPTPAQKPRVDVTRAPMSVAPGPTKPIQGSDSAVPGNAPGEQPRRRGCFGFC